MGPGSGSAGHPNHGILLVRHTHATHLPEIPSESQWALGLLNRPARRLAPPGSQLASPASPAMGVWGPAGLERWTRELRPDATTREKEPEVGSRRVRFPLGIRGIRVFFILFFVWGGGPDYFLRGPIFDHVKIGFCAKKRKNMEEHVVVGSFCTRAEKGIIPRCANPFWLVILFYPHQESCAISLGMDQNQKQIILAGARAEVAKEMPVGDTWPKAPKTWFAACFCLHLPRRFVARPRTLQGNGLLKGPVPCKVSSTSLHVLQVVLL